MLVIRDAQIQALIADTDEKLEEIIENAVRKAAPVRVQGVAPERVWPMVRRCIERARHEGFEKAEDIGAFSALMFVLSPHFYREQAIADVLNDDRYPAGERLFQLFERVPDQSWPDAVDLYNEQFWFAEKPKEVEPAAAEPADSEKVPVDYRKLTLEQSDVVEKTIEGNKDSPSEETMKQVELELEKLSFYRTAMKGGPKERARQAAETARSVILNKAITQPLGAGR